MEIEWGGKQSKENVQIANKEEVYNDNEDDKNTEYIRNIMDEEDKASFMNGGKKEDGHDDKGS